jgi:hypothetical protein
MTTGNAPYGMVLGFALSTSLWMLLAKLVV